MAEKILGNTVTKSMLRQADGGRVGDRPLDLLDVPKR